MQDTTNISEDLRSRIRLLQIIVSAFIFGLTVFILIASLLPSAAPAGPGATAPPLDILRLVWAFFLITEVPFYFVFRASLKRNTASMAALTDDTLMQRYFVLTLLGAAMAEGVSLFGGVIFIIGRESLDVLLAVPGLVALLILFPTLGRFINFSRSVRETQLNSRPLR